MRVLGSKEQQIMDYLHEHVFDPILASPAASQALKQGVRYTIMRMEEGDAPEMVQYYLVNGRQKCQRGLILTPLGFGAGIVVLADQRPIKRLPGIIIRPTTSQYSSMHRFLIIRTRDIAISSVSITPEMRVCFYMKPPFIKHFRDEARQKCG